MERLKKLIGLIILSTLLVNENIYALDDNNGSSVEISLPRMVNGIIHMDNNIKIEEQIINYSNEYIAVNIYKPIIKMKDKVVEKKINKKIEDTINQYEKRILDLSEKDNEFNKVNGLDIKQYILNINNTIHYNDDDILSMTLEVYTYMGGAHGSTMDIPFNFDVKTGNRGVLEDFLGNNENYNKIIIDNIRRAVDKNPDLYFKDILNKYEVLPYNQKFYLTKDGVVIFFDEYEVAPYAAGRVEFVIPYTEFPKGLKKVNIVNEIPVVNSMLKEEAGLINKYLNYPLIKNMNNEEAENKINSFFESEIDSFNSDILSKKNNLCDSNKNIKGITTYFTSNYKDKNSLLVYITYLASDEKDEEIIIKTKEYIINLLDGNIVISQ